MKTIAMLAGAAVLALSANAIAQQAAPPPPPPPGAPMDPMGDRTLTRAEADAQARKMFAMMDVNKDGKVDKADREARQAEKFRKLDADGNGSLSPGEFAAKGDRKDGPGREGKRMGMRGPGGHGPMGGPGGGMGMMMLRMADANKDGAVTEAEFLDAHAKHFAMLDTNKDGSVTAQERRAAMTKMRDHMKQMRGGQHDGMKHGEGHEHPTGA